MRTMETGMRIRDTGRCLLMAMLLMVTMNGHAQQTDPALTAAVTAQTFTLKSLFDTRHSTQEKILAATGIEEVQLKQLHAIEQKVLDYMANVTGLMQNLYQVKRTTELVTVEIPRNISAVTSACKGHLKGTAIALAVSDASLEDINSALYILSWQIQYLSWEDLWRGLDPDTWCNYMQGKWMAESCIRDWDDLLK